MELLMKNIHMCRQAKRAGTQITLGEDLNVPDIRPDAEIIIQSQERVTLEHTRAEEGRLFVDGFVEIGILYLDDTKEHQLHRLDAKLPFDETIAMGGLAAGDAVRVQYETEDLTVTLINSRKLAISCLLAFEASVDEIYDLSAAVETQTDLEVCEKKSRLALMQLEVQNRDILRLKEEFALPANKPEMAELLWESIQLRSCRALPADGEIEVQGNLAVFVLYRAQDDGGSIQWLEQQLPFAGRLTCSASKSSLIPDIELSLAQAELGMKEDTDGEQRLLHLEGVLELEIRLYGREEAEILEDIYSPEKKLELDVREEAYESFVMRNESKCRASGKIRIQGAKPRILQICYSGGSVKIDNTKIVPNGIVIEGAVPVSILYITPDDARPFAVLDGIIPFTHQAEIPEIDTDCRFSLTTGMEQLTAAMADSEEIEVKASVRLTLFVVRSCKQQCICAVDEQDYALEQLEAVPGMIGYIVQGQESLWEIGKQYYMSPQQIMEMNGLESEQVKKGDRLILMKSIGRQMERQ